MNHREVCVVAVLWGSATLLSSCTKPPPVAVLDPRFGFPVDGVEGLYAYTTPLPAKEPQDVAVRIAPAEFFAPPIEGSFGDPPMTIYRKSDAIIVDPVILAGLLDGAEVEAAPDKYAVLGCVAISIAAYPRPGPSGARGGRRADGSGLAYLEIDDRQTALLTEVIDDMRRAAASYGADAVVNLRVHLNDWGSSTGIAIIGDNHIVAEADLISVPK